MGGGRASRTQHDASPLLGLEPARALPCAPDIRTGFVGDRDIAAASDRDRTLNLWGVTTRSEIATTKHSADWYTSVAFSPDEKSLAAGNQGRSITIWDFAKVRSTGRFPR
jgi:WD40 repeat protein